MPRICDSHNDNIELCRSCFTADVAAGQDFLIETYGPDYDLDVEHPPYSDADYICESCTAPLTNRDN